MATLGNQLVLFGYIQRAASIVVGAPAASGFPASNLLLPRLSDQWWSPVGSLVGVKIQFDLGGSRTDIEHVVLHGVNWTILSTWRVRIATALTAFTGGAGTVTWDSGTVLVFNATTLPCLVDDTPPWGRMALALPPSTMTGAYVEVVVNDATNAANQLVGSNFNTGPVFQPGINYSRDWKMPDQFEGQPGLEKTIRGHALTLGRLTEGEARKLISVLRTMRRTGRLYICPRPLNPETWLDQALLATVSNYDQAVTAGLDDRRQITLTFAEVDD